MPKYPVMKRIEAGHWQIAFDQMEARGVVDLSAQPHGLSVAVDGYPACLIDLNHLAAGTGPAQVVIDDAGRGDTIAVAMLYGGHQTQLYFNSDVQVVGFSGWYGAIYGRKK